MGFVDGKQIANNIKAERNRANIVIDDVCKTLDISRPTYISYEKDASNIKTSVLIELAKLFDCDINMFFYRK